MTMAERMKCESARHRQVNGRGSLWSLHPLWVCLVVCILAHRIVPSLGVCTSNHQPTIQNQWRRHLDELSSIAAIVLDDASVIIPPSFTDDELDEVTDRLRILAPAPMAHFDQTCQSELNQEMDRWIWMCRGLQTLGRRRRRETDNDKLA